MEEVDAFSLAALRWNSQDERAYRLIGLSRLAQRDVKTAEKFLVTAVNLARTKAIASFWLGNAYEANFNLDKAEASWYEADAGVWLLHRASRCIQDGDQDKASMLYQIAINILQAPGAPSSFLAQAYAKLAEIYSMNNRRQDAEKAYSSSVYEYSRLLQQNPKSAEYLMGRAQVYDELGSLDLAERDLLLAVNYAPYNLKASVYGTLGNHYIASRKLTDAISAFEAAIKLQPSGTYYYLQLAWVYWEQKDLAQAERVLLKALETAPDDKYRSTVFFRLGQLYASERKWDNAIAAYERAVNLDSGRRDFRQTLAEAYLATGKKEQAIHEYIILADSNPADKELRMRLEELCGRIEGK